jgi:hypothetical protein
MSGSVPARQFGQIDGHPAVMGEVVELNLAKEGSRDGRRCESPRIWISAEFEAGNEKAKTDAGLGAGDLRELLEDELGTGCRHCDPDQTALSLGGDQLAELAGDRALGCSRLPLGAGREPSDGFFVGWDVSGTGSDVSRVDDLFEFLAGCEVVDNGWIGGRWSCRRWDGDQMDVDLHGVGTYWGPGVWWENKPRGVVSGRRGANRPGSKGG